MEIHFVTCKHCPSFNKERRITYTLIPDFPLGDLLFANWQNDIETESAGKYYFMKQRNMNFFTQNIQH